MITRAEFKQDVRAWAQEIGVVPKEIHIREIRPTRIFLGILISYDFFV